MPDQLTIGLLGGTGVEPERPGGPDPGRATAGGPERPGSRDLAIEGVGNADAAAHADVVFLVFPFAGLAGPIGDRVVVDVVNPLGWDRQGPYRLEVPEGSAAEQAAAPLPRARVVAAFDHAAPKLLAGPDRQVETDVLAAGDHEEGP